MNKKKPGAWRDKINKSRRVHRPGGGKPSTKKAPLFDAEGRPKPAYTGARPRPIMRDTDGLEIVEREPETPTERGAFRVLIAIHRPRYRGRAERAAALVGWEVTALLNKQDPVGQAAKPPRPPDLLVMSSDFGRQRDLAIFRAVQKWRGQGMRLIGLTEDCETAPEGFPDSAPSQLCDECLTPPFTAADLRQLFVRLYEEMRGEAAPPPRTAQADDEPDEE